MIFIRGSSGSSAKNDNYLQNGQKSYKDRATYGQRNKDDSILYTVKTVVAPFPVSTSETQWGARSARPLLPKKKIVSNANRGDSYNENDKEEEQEHSHSHSLEEPGSGSGDGSTLLSNANYMSGCGRRRRRCRGPPTSNISSTCVLFHASFAIHRPGLRICNA